MAINKGTLGKQTKNGVEYVYPKTSADLVEYTSSQSVKDKLDTIVNMTGASSSAAGTSGLVPAPAAGKQASFLRGDGTWVVPTDTKYSAGTGISLSGTTFSNSGVRSIATGSTNGTISVNTNGTSADVAVKGLGSLAYKSSLTASDVGALASNGTAAAATKLDTPRAIDGISFDGSAAIVHYGSCSTAAGTAAKTVACTSFTLDTGSRIIVKFTVTNTATNPTLNVNSTGDKAIYYRGAAVTAGYLAANRTYEFVYNGTQYDLVGDIDTNTTYSTATQSTSGLMSNADKVKLDGIAAGATKITVDSALSSTSTNPVQNKVINTAIESRATKTAATQSTAGLMSAGDKVKLDGISTGATRVLVDTDLSTSSTNAIQNKAVATALATKASTDVATTSANGLMSSGDKTKLGGIATGAEVNVINSVKMNNTALAITSKAVNIPVFTGATASAAGAAGVAPAPAAGDTGKFLCGDGSWKQVVSGVQSNWNTTNTSDLSYILNKPEFNVLTSSDDGNGNVTLSYTTVANADLISY